jgi:putative Holliday junction resolvase
VAFDPGARRTGVAVSDVSGTLARPYGCLSGGHRLDAAVDLVTALHAEADGLGTIVVGLPRRLDGSDSEQTPAARAFAAALASRTGLPVVLQDERLTSVEAESRLARREPDWRRRKGRLDAAAAAVILQDYLDTVPRTPPSPAGPLASDASTDGEP